MASSQVTAHELPLSSPQSSRGNNGGGRPKSSRARANRDRSTVPRAPPGNCDVFSENGRNGVFAGQKLAILGENRQKWRKWS